MSNLRIPENFTEKDIKRSINDLSQNIYTSIMQGQHIMIKSERLYPKDNFEIDYLNILDSMPMVGRLLNGWRLRIMCFKSNLSNYYSWMDNNNRVSTSDYKTKRHHCMTTSHVTDSELRDAIYASLFEGMITSRTELIGMPSDLKISVAFTSLMSIIPSLLTSNTYLKPTQSYQKYFGVQPSSFLNYIGFPKGFIGLNYESSSPYALHTTYQADDILCYLDAIRNYCVNNQLDEVPYCYTIPVFSKVDIQDSLFEISTYRGKFGYLELSLIDKFFKYLRMEDNGVDLVAWLYNNPNFDILEKTSLFKWFFSLRFGGHFLCQYESDMMNTLLQKVNVSDINITVSGNTFSINDFRLKNREQLFQDRLDISGGRWSRILRAVWGSKTDGSMDIPELIGVTSSFINSRSVISTANTDPQNDGSGASLGQLGSLVTSKDKSYRHKIYSPDHARLFFIVSLVPEVVYQNGLGKGLDSVNFMDEYHPQFENLGYQDVSRYKYNCMPQFDHANGVYNVSGSSAIASYTQVMGKNVAWLDLISNVDRVNGFLSSDEYFDGWLLKNTYSTREVAVEDGKDIYYDEPLTSFTNYVNPFNYQAPFVLQGPRDHNFVFQLGFDIKAVRPKGKWYMPTLGN